MACHNSLLIGPLRDMAIENRLSIWSLKHSQEWDAVVHYAVKSAPIRRKTFRRFSGIARNYPRGVRIISPPLP